MDARVRISRRSGWGRHTVVLDDEDAGAVGRDESVAIDVASGTHTPQLIDRFGLASPVERFSVRAGETAALAGHPPSFVAAIPRLVTVLLPHRGSWITVERTGHHAADAEANPSEHQRNLIKQIQAAQANQPGIER
jgi:hypothetical protein